jgi:hypothetical protein
VIQLWNSVMLAGGHGPPVDAVQTSEDFGGIRF